MRVPSRLLLVLVVLVASAVVDVPRALAAPTPLAECIGPGGQPATTSVKLTTDLTCSGDGIVVGKDGITIDLNGHTVTGDRGPTDIGIKNLGGYVDVTVTGGVVEKFAVGVQGFNTSDRMQLTHVVVSGNIAGVDIFGDSVRVSSSKFTGNGSSGILIHGDSARVVSSEAHGNVLIGILVDGDSARVTSSQASGNGNQGINIQGASARVTSSQASGNDDHGIVVQGASALVTASQASGNGLDGIFVEGASPRVTSSQAYGNDDDGVHIEGASARVRSSRVSGNGTEGIDVSGDAARIGRLPGGPASDKNYADANGFVPVDAIGVGIWAHDFTTAPIGKNVARGNDDPRDCLPETLC